MKHLLKLAVVAFIFTPVVTLAAISQLKIVTDSQTVKPGTISAKITVQAQDENGTSQNIDSTAHLQVETTSSTGEFSSSDSTWKAVSSLTMSKGTANRSFYYKDSSVGTYTLKVGAADGQSWAPATQTIIIGEAADTPNTVNTTNSDEETVSGSSTETEDGVSTHSSQIGLSDIEIKSPSVGIGRKRYTTAGSVITFEAWIKDSDNVKGSYLWSFGDGSSVSGEKVSHTYSFPGTYNVILNADFNDKEAVSRTVVKVLPVEIEIKKVDTLLGYVELFNNSTLETNLSGWNFNCGNNFFTFPRDTIIDAKNSLKVPLFLTRCVASTTAWSLKNQSKKVLAEYTISDQGKANEEIRQKIKLVIAELEKRKNQLSVNQGLNVINNIETKIATDTLEPQIGPSQTAGVIVLDKDPLPTSKSLFNRVKLWFRR